MCKPAGNDNSDKRETGAYVFHPPADPVDRTSQGWCEKSGDQADGDNCERNRIPEEKIFPFQDKETKENKRRDCEDHYCITENDLPENGWSGTNDKKWGDNPINVKAVNPTTKITIAVVIAMIFP